MLVRSLLLKSRKKILLHAVVYSLATRTGLVFDVTHRLQTQICSAHSLCFFLLFLEVTFKRLLQRSRLQIDKNCRGSIFSLFLQTSIPAEGASDAPSRGIHFNVCLLKSVGVKLEIMTKLDQS